MRNGVLDIFTPMSPRRRKRNLVENNAPSNEGFNSLNGSVISGNIVYNDDVRSGMENVAEKDWSYLNAQIEDHNNGYSMPTGTFPNINRTN